MRGEPFHNSIAVASQEIASRRFDFVGTEYVFRRNGVTTVFDVFARRGVAVLAFEVETTARHAVDNARKAVSVGVPTWIVVPSRRLKLQLTGRLDRLQLRPAGEPIKILLLGQLEQELTNYLSLFIPADREHGKQ